MSEEVHPGGGTSAPPQAPSTGCAERVRAPLTEAKPGPSEAAEVTGGLVREALLEAVRLDHDLLDAAREAAQGVAAAVAKGAVPMWLAARGAAAGASLAAHELRRDPGPAVAAVTRALMEEALSADGDFGAAAKGAVQGAIWAADLAGTDAGEACRAAARVALETAAAVRFGARERVRHILINPVEGYPTGIE